MNFISRAVQMKPTASGQDITIRIVMISLSENSRAEASQREERIPSHQIQTL